MAAKTPANMQMLIGMLVTAGYSYEAIHHRKDSLGVFVDDTSRPVVDDFYSAQGLNRALYAPVIRDTLTRKPMYACTFPTIEDEVQEVTA